MVLISVFVLLFSGGLVFVGYFVYVLCMVWCSLLCLFVLMVVLVFGWWFECDEFEVDYCYWFGCVLVLVCEVLVE